MTPEELLPLVYQELRHLAAAKLASEQPGQTLNATALVHETWLKLADAPVDWNDKTRFIRAAATAMRHILVDRARQTHHQARRRNPTRRISRLCRASARFRAIVPR